MTRAVGAAGIALIKRFETCRLEAYQDVAGVWTIGWGHVRGVKSGDTCSQEQADLWLAEDIAAKASAVDTATFDVPTSAAQYDAMAAFAFNVGTAGFACSSVLRLHRLGDIAAAGGGFLLWDKAHVGGVLVEVAGLRARREAERALYLTEAANV